MADLTEETQAQDDAQPTTNRQLLLGLMLLLLKGTQKSLQEFSAAYIAGTLTLLELHDALVQTLIDSHSHAAYLGRQLAGQTEAFGQQDTTFAAAVLDGQAQYLEGLLADYESGRYVGEDGAVSGALDNRLDLYALGLRATAQASWLFAQDPEQMIDWVLGPSDHCSQCPDLAEGSPYKAGELMQVPGDGQTPCLSRCDCSLVIVDGEAGVPFIEI